MSDSTTPKAWEDLSPEEQKEARRAERLLLSISLLILIGLVGTMLYLHFTQGSNPAAFRVTPLLQETSQQNGLYYLPVEIKNTGDRTAATVLVTFELLPQNGGSGEPLETAEVSIDYLSGGLSQEAYLTFEHDPRQSLLRYRITYLKP